MSATSDILDFVADANDVPAHVLADAERLLADTLAVGAAGSCSREARKMREAIGQGRVEGIARRLDGSRGTREDAAFHNGFAIHCLEWDAVHEGAVVHALSVVTAALLAQSDARGGSDPDAFLAALAIGVDVASGLGIAATGPMRFFRPATAGVIGAALASARLSGMDRAKLPDVLGLAYSFASGTMQAHVEASIALPLQIANAARSAVTAVALVSTGMDGPRDALDGTFGYGALIEPLDLSRYVEELGRSWRIAEVAVKPFPSGRASHGALGELEALFRDGMRIGDVDCIELLAPPLIERLVGRKYDPGMSPAYARLCLAILAPLMLRDGQIDPALFEDDALHAPELVTLAHNVTVEVDDNPDGNAMTPQRLLVTMKDGRRIERIVAATVGSVENPMDAAQRRAKYDLCRKLGRSRIDPRLFDNPLSYAAEPT
ncbi:MAG: MmgE/PrpD family protein [Erythrobacter sp.]